ncbi:hypothetical protein IWW56_005400 [Coemansia sp. RSA 2131]|nr:hypothetical protein IWW56_005400 [Coemansia sp. RSA 2131]
MELRPFASLAETANYVAKAMLTDYANNVMQNFGNTWRHTINMLLNCKQRQAELVTQLKAKDKSAPEIKRECEARIWGLARRLKESLGTGRPVGISIAASEVVCTPEHNSRLGDIKCTQALPLRRSWVYSHVPLNTCILVRCIFGKTYTATPGGKDNIQLDIKTHWGCTVDLQQDMFRLHKRHEFKGVVMTDGVSISVVRETVNEEPVEISTNLKRKHEEPEQQLQHGQLVAQRAWLAYQLVQQPTYQPSYQPMVPPLYQLSYPPLVPLPYQPLPYQLFVPLPYQPLYQLMVQPPVQQEQQPWVQVVQQAQEAWEARQARLSAEQARQESLLTEQALCVLQAQLSAQPARLPAQQLPQQTQPVQR